MSEQPYFPVVGPPPTLEQRVADLERRVRTLEGAAALATMGGSALVGVGVALVKAASTPSKAPTKKGRKR